VKTDSTFESDDRNRVDPVRMARRREGASRTGSERRWMKWLLGACCGPDRAGGISMLIASTLVI
jgi:hypothetical protein